MASEPPDHVPVPGYRPAAGASESPIPANPSTQMKAALEFLGSLAKVDVPMMLKMTTEDFQVVCLPQSMNIPTVSDRNVWIQKCATSPIMGDGYRVSHTIVNATSQRTDDPSV